MPAYFITTRSPLARQAFALLVVSFAAAWSGGCVEERVFNNIEGMAGASGDGGGSGSGGSDGGPNDQSSIKLETATLPKAWFNMDYSATLEASGGEGQLTWTVEGELPAGLELDEQGVLTGIPSEFGEFSITFVVTDGSGQKKSFGLTLKIDRKRWLAYTVTEGVPRKEQVFLVDLSSTLLPRFPLFQGQKDHTQVRQLEFSPDGKHLVAVADVATKDFNEAFLVSLDGKAPGSPVKINGDEKVSTTPVVSWSPDGNWLALVTDDSTNKKLRVVDVTQGSPTASKPIVTQSNIFSTLWLSNSHIVWGGTGTMQQAKADASGFGPPQTFGDGTPYQAFPDTQRVAFGTREGDGSSI